MNLRVKVLLLALLAVISLTSCSAGKSGATAPERPNMELIDQVIVPSYGDYPGGILYHYFDHSNHKDIYIFNGQNKAGMSIY